MFKSLLFILPFLFTSLIAENTCAPEPSKCTCEPEKPCCAVPAPPCVAAYNSPARVNVCGSNDFFVGFSFIYWKMEEQIFATKSKATNNINTNDLNQFELMKYDYKPGFKVGLGYNFEYDDWTTYIEYTRYHATNKKTFTKPASLFLQGAYNRRTDTSADKVDFSIDLEYDTVDLEISRWQYNGKKFQMNPYVGLKGGWLEQDFTSDLFIDSLSIKNHAKVDANLWFIGPRIGLYYKYKLSSCFSFSGEAATSLSYQKINKLALVQEDLDLFLSLPPTLTNSDLKQSAGGGAFELMLGFEFDKYFYYNKCHFNCFAGYDFQGISSVLLPPRQLLLHGLTLTGRFDF